MTITQIVQAQQQQRIGEIPQRSQGKPHVNPYGTPGMSLNGAGDCRKIVPVDKSVAQQVKQIAFDHMKNGYGVSDGEDISKIIRDYTMSLAPEQRLSASWTLNEMFHSEAARLGEYVHQHDPNWDWGKPFDTRILDGYQQNGRYARFDAVSIRDNGAMRVYSDFSMSIEARQDAPIRDPDAKIRVYYNALSGRDYYLTQERAQNGAVADYFFELCPDDIEQQAKAVLSGEGYDPYHPATESFVKGLCQWFSADDTKSVADTFEAVCREYAGILEAGRTPALSELKTTFSFCGEEVSVSELFNMVEAGRKISQQSNRYGCIGTSMYVGLAAEGMLKSAALSYADTLSSGIGKVFADNFTRLFDNSAKCSMQKWNAWSEKDISGTLPEDYRNYIADQASYAYQLFSQSNLSSGDVSDKINQFCIKNQYAYGGIVTTDFRSIMTGYYQEIKKLFA